MEQFPGPNAIKLFASGFGHNRHNSKKNLAKITTTLRIRKGLLNNPLLGMYWLRRAQFEMAQKLWRQNINQSPCPLFRSILPPKNCCWKIYYKKASINRIESNLSQLLNGVDGDCELFCPIPTDETRRVKQHNATIANRFSIAQEHRGLLLGIWLELNPPPHTQDEKG